MYIWKILFTIIKSHNPIKGRRFKAIEYLDPENKLKVFHLNNIVVVTNGQNMRSLPLGFFNSFSKTQGCRKPTLRHNTW